MGNSEHGAYDIRVEPLEADPAADRVVYTVSELTRQIKQHLEQALPSVWVQGEISNLSRPASGHLYFSLKDESSQLGAVMFRMSAASLGFALEDGMKVLAFGKISVYEKGGRYQIVVVRLEPQGIGALQLALEQLKKKLAAEGLFDPARKKPLPEWIHSVGIVTSPSGAAIRDILQITRRRNAHLRIVLRPVQVQGDPAAEQIVEAIDDFNQLGQSGRFGQVDVLIVGRGGGSAEDLWSFNDERVARAIARSRIPVISAVGHEIDWTIADGVADLRAPTPSAAAELVTQSAQELKVFLDSSVDRLRAGLTSVAERMALRLSALAQARVFRFPLEPLDEFRQQVDDLARRLPLEARRGVEQARQDLTAIGGRLSALSPLAVLERGYSVTRRKDNGQVIRSPKDVQLGEMIRTTLWKGDLVSRVE